MAENEYTDGAVMAEVLSEKRHREMIGGRWEEIGALQYNYLKSAGLMPHHKLADIGCGSLRGGVHFVRYLEAGNYYGFDLVQGLIDAGLAHELQPLGLLDKVSPEQFHAAEGFDFPKHWQGGRQGGRQEQREGEREGEGLMDMAIALSLFTHLTMNSISQCLHKARRILKTGAEFHATIFLGDPDNINAPFSQGDGFTSYAVQDPYHYCRADMDYLARKNGYSLEGISGFDHPRHQVMTVFKKQ